VTQLINKGQVAVQQEEPISHSQRLQQRIQLIRSGLDRAALAFWSHPHLRELYPELLFRIHCFSRATIPLMTAAKVNAQAVSESDLVAKCLVDYLSEHILEEQGHDEWLLEDMEVLGIERKAVLKRVPVPTATALVGTQYYWIFHSHPVALLGFLTVMEGSPPRTEFLEEAIVRTGLPAGAFRTYLRHAHLDLQHRNDLFATLDRMPLTREHLAFIGVSAFQTVHLSRLLFEELVESHTRQSSLDHTWRSAPSDRF
jgi:Iron-containing redox enzyme